MRNYLFLAFFLMIFLFAWVADPFASSSPSPVLENRSAQPSSPQVTSPPVTAAGSRAPSSAAALEDGSLAPGRQLPQSSSNFSSLSSPVPASSAPVRTFVAGPSSSESYSPTPSETMAPGQTSANSGRFIQRENSKGTNSKDTPVTDGSQAVPAAETTTDSGNEVVVPLIWQEASPELKLTEDQAASFEALQAKFVEDVGGVEQNPTDPAYRDKWVAAQEESDEKFRALFGWQALSQFKPGQETVTPKP